MVLNALKGITQLIKCMSPVEIVRGGSTVTFLAGSLTAKTFETLAMR